MEPFQHAIIGFGRGQADRSVVAFGAQVGAALGVSRYTLAHVLRSPDLPTEAADKFDSQQFRAQILEEMAAAQAAETAWPAAAEFEQVVLAGVAGEQLVRLAAQDKADLVVVGRQRHKAQDTLGLAAGRLVHQSPVSVLVTSRDAPRKIARLLVPVDFSPHAADAVSVAQRIGAATGAEVVVQHVYRVPPGFEKAGDSFESYAASLRANAEQRWAEFSSDLLKAGPAPTVRFDLIPHEDWQSKPADIVANTADELSSDMIVCGSHGHTGLARVFLGSTSEGILKRTRRTVFCVKRKNENIGLLRAIFGEEW